MNPTFKYLTKLFQKLPGVGPRQAARFVLALLDRRQEELEEFGNAIVELKQSVSFCQECFNIAESRADLGDLCHICINPKRDPAKLMVLEKVTDLSSVERTGLYNGQYHVLGGAINPVDGINPENLRIAELQSRLTRMRTTHPSIELILATNPSTAGDTTLLYLREMFQNTPGLTLTRLGRGLASGSNLEYADELTLKHALDHRK